MRARGGNARGELVGLFGRLWGVWNQLSCRQKQFPAAGGSACLSTGCAAGVRDGGRLRVLMQLPAVGYVWGRLARAGAAKR